MLQKQGDLTLVSKTGKLEIKSKSDDSGLLDVIRQKNRPQYPTMLGFDIEGNSFAQIDKAGNGTMYYINKNRYVNFTTSTNGSNLKFIEKGHGQLAVALKNNNIAIYNNLNGKLIQTLKWHQYHIVDLQVNHMKNLLLSVSHDCCALWNINNYQRSKTLFAKSGKFVSAVFSPNGTQLITLFQDGSVYFWNLDTLETEQKSQLPNCNRANGLKIQCSLESDCIVIAGQQNCMYVCRLNDKNLEFQCYDLPSGVQNILNFRFYKNGQLCFVGSDSNFYLTQINLNSSILLKHTIPGQRGILDFDVNVRAEIVIFAASTGEVYLYNLQKLVQNQQRQENQLIQSGVGYDIVKQTLTLKNNRQMILPSYKGSDQINQENDENINNESNENGTVYEEVHIVQQGQQSNKKVLIQNSQNQPKNYKDSHKLEKLYKSSQLKIENTYMDINKLRGFLKKFKQYPEKHRPLIYKYILQLPLNFEAYDNLVIKGTHNAFVDLNKIYPIESQKLYTKMQRILSALAHYCPVFSEIDYIPAVVFPFIKLFGVDEVLCFEVILSFMVQWGQHLFSFFPNPPINMLQSIDEILKQSDFPLQQHLKNCDFGLNNYLWPPLQVLFTDMLSRQDWLCFMDFLISHPDKPELLLYVVASLFIHYRDPLLKIKTPQELDIFLHRQASVKIQNVLERALSICKSLGSQNLQVKYEHNLPLTQNQYPIFNFYPQFAIDSHAKLREQIQNEEKQIQQRQNQILHINELTKNMQEMEEKLREKEEQLLRAEKDRREMTLYEEELRLTKKNKLDQQFRDSRLQHLTNLEKQMRESIEKQVKLKEQDLENLAFEIQAKEKLDNMQLHSKKEEEALANLEMKSGARMQELIALRAREERVRRDRIEYEKLTRQQQLQDYLQDERFKAEDLEMRLRRDLVQNQKDREMQQLSQENDRREREKRLAETAFLKDMKMAEVERDRRLRQIAEQDVFKNLEMEKLKREQQEILRQEDKKHLDQILNKEKDNQLKRAYERLRILEIEKNKQFNEIQEHMERLKEIKNIQHRQDLEQKIVDLRREAEQNIFEEEKRTQQMILDLEEERRVQRQMVDEIENREIQYRQQDEFHNELRQREEQVIEEERQNFDQFREQVREELGPDQSENQRRSLKSSLKPSQYQNQNQQYLQQQNNMDQQLQSDMQTSGIDFSKEEEILRRTAELKKQIQQQNIKRIEEQYMNKPSTEGQRNQTGSVKFSNQGNTQSLYSYSVSDKYGNPQNFQQGGENQQSFNPRQSDPQMESLQSSENKEQFTRYQPQQHFEESEDDDNIQQQQQQQQYGLGSQLTYSSGPSTANKPLQRQQY